MEKITRDVIFRYVMEKYGSSPEYLWQKFPTYAVLRKRSSGKWYAAVMNIPKSRLGLADETVADVLNVKCPPDLIGSFIDRRTYFPAYHMNKEHWISILLETASPSDRNNIFNLIDLSYELV